MKSAFFVVTVCFGIEKKIFDEIFHFQSSNVTS